MIIKLNNFQLKMIAIKWYGNKLDTKPIRTKVITAFFTFSLADLACQVIEIKYTKNNIKKINWKRALRQGSYCLIAAPWLHYYTTAMIPTFFPMGTKFRLLKSVVYDSFIHMPMYVTGIFTYLDLMSGKSLKQTYHEVKIKAKHTIKKAWSFRPWVMYINFCFVPMQWRVLYINAFGFVWNIYLSWVQNVRSKKLLQDKQMLEAKLNEELEEKMKIVEEEVSTMSQ